MRATRRRCEMEEMGGRWSDGRGEMGDPRRAMGYDAAQYGRWRRAGEMSGASLIHESTYNLRCNARYQICSLEVSGTLTHLAHRAPTTTPTAKSSTRPPHCSTPRPR